MTNKQLSDVQKQIEDYLVEQVKDGKQYFKSRYIANQLDLSAKVVGTNISLLREKTERISIDIWSNSGSSGSVWTVDLADNNTSSPKEPRQVATHADD